MRHQIDASNQHTFFFDSWQQFVDYADTTPSEMESSHRMSHSNSMGRESHPVVKHWNGYPSWEDCIAKSKGGWPAGAAEIEKSFNNMHIPQKRVEKEFAYSPVGPGTLSMGRFIQGHPESWMTERDSDRVTEQDAFHNGVAHLGVNISQSGGVTATERFHMGALVLTLIDMLERNGVRVELTLFNAISGSNNSYIRQAVKIKSADSSANLSILAAAFGNAGTQRRLCWGIRETLDQKTRKDCNIGGGYGHTDPRWYEGDCTLIQGLGDVQFNNPTRRNDWLKGQLAQHGVWWDGE
jgi:hypothetical protein